MFQSMTRGCLILESSFPGTTITLQAIQIWRHYSLGRISLAGPRETETWVRCCRPLTSLELRVVTRVGRGQGQGREEARLVGETERDGMDPITAISTHEQLNVTFVPTWTRLLMSHLTISKEHLLSMDTMSTFLHLRGTRWFGLSI